MKHTIKNLFTLLFLVCFSTVLFADRYPKVSKHASFKACPVNAHAGKRAKTRHTHIHKPIMKPKTDHVYTESGAHTSGSGTGGAASSAPAEQNNINDQPQRVEQENSAPKKDTATVQPPQQQRVEDDVNTDVEVGTTSVGKASVDAPQQIRTINNVVIPDSKTDVNPNGSVNTNANAADINKPKAATPGPNGAAPTKVAPQKVNVQLISNPQMINIPDINPGYIHN